VAGKPNVLIIWGDDIGISNLSCYSDGLMGYRTPNIDRIAAEGVRFTDYYGEQSCTAGRAAFITGQNPYRTGLTKVGMPGADVGLRAEDPTMAARLGWTTVSIARDCKTVFPGVFTVAEESLVSGRHRCWLRWSYRMAKKPHTGGR
jgi:arylsulfatase A-like enzyme